LGSSEGETKSLKFAIYLFYLNLENKKSCGKFSAQETERLYTADLVILVMLRSSGRTLDPTGAVAML
jgi:hypothetical protein